MSHWPEYDYVVVNRDLDRAFGDSRHPPAERLKRERQTGLSAFVRGLQSKLLKLGAAPVTSARPLSMT